MRAFGAVLVAVSLAACGTVGGNRDDGARRQREVTEATAAWVAAYNSRDPARITAQYDRDAILWGTTSATIRADPASIADYFKDAAKRPDARVAITDQHIRLGIDMAVATGSYTFTDVRDGKSVANPSRFTFVLADRGGRWVILHHHSSRVPAP